MVDPFPVGGALNFAPPGAAYMGFCSPPLAVRLAVFPEARSVFGSMFMALWETLEYGEVSVPFPASAVKKKKELASWVSLGVQAGTSINSCPSSTPWSME